MNEDVYSVSTTLAFGFKARIAYLSVPPVGGAAHRPIMPVRIEAIAGEQLTKAEVEDDLLWCLSEGVGRWGVHNTTDNQADHSLDVFYKALAQKGKRASGRAVEGKMNRMIVSINLTEFVLMQSNREGSGWISSVVHIEPVKDLTKLAVSQLTKLAAKLATKAYPLVKHLP